MKIVVQLLAAAACGRPLMLFTFHNDELAKATTSLYSLIEDSQATVGRNHSHLCRDVGCPPPRADARQMNCAICLRSPPASGFVSAVLAIQPSLRRQCWDTPQPLRLSALRPAAEPGVWARRRRWDGRGRGGNTDTGAGDVGSGYAGRRLAGHGRGRCGTGRALRRGLADGLAANGPSFAG